VLHVIPARSFEHAQVTSQVMELLAAPARAARLIPAMGGFNLGESERDYRAVRDPLITARIDSAIAIIAIAANTGMTSFAAHWVVASPRPMTGIERPM
jgi:hypothetical protein